MLAQLCPILCNFMGCSPPGSSLAHVIYWVRIPEWVALSFSKGSFWPRDPASVSCIGRRTLYHWATWEACFMYHTNKENAKMQLGFLLHYGISILRCYDNKELWKENLTHFCFSFGYTWYQHTLSESHKFFFFKQNEWLLDFEIVYFIEGV